MWLSLTRLRYGRRDCCHIFEQFYQGDTSHRTQGNGLGLAMAQKIAALHGGAVTVDSRPGSGSCFTVVLQ